MKQDQNKKRVLQQRNTQQNSLKTVVFVHHVLAKKLDITDRFCMGATP